MSEQNTNIPFNPLDPANFTSGGGLWDGKVITITGSRCTVDRLSYGSGEPVIDDRTGEQAFRNVWEIKGIAEDSDQERRETYSLGALVPTADGEGFLKDDGKVAALSGNSAAGKFVSLLAEGGFDTATLFDAESNRITVSKLVGAQILFQGIARKNKNGEEKKNKNGYVEYSFFPEKFVGYKDGVKAPSAAVSTEAVDEARALVVAILGENGGTAPRATVVREVNVKLKGQHLKAQETVQLILKPEFHAGAPWTLDGSTMTLA